MTLVVTHANGYLGCFTQNPDGTMRQRALIDTGDEPPTAAQLAEIGTTMADQWGWQLSALPAQPSRKQSATALPKGDPVAELKAVEKRRKSGAPKPKRGYDNTSDIPKADRERLIPEFLASNPYRTAAEIITGLGYEADDKRIARWHHSFIALWEAGRIARRIREGSKTRLNEYYLNTVDVS